MRASHVVGCFALAGAVCVSVDAASPDRSPQAAGGAAAPRAPASCASEANAVTRAGAAVHHPTRSRRLRARRRDPSAGDAGCRDAALMGFHFEKPLLSRGVAPWCRAIRERRLGPPARSSVYCRASTVGKTTFDASTSTSNMRIGPEGTIIAVLESGSLIEANRLRGWQFESDPQNPLVFKAVGGTGYVYLCGKGKVTSPDGMTRVLGEDATPATWITRLGNGDKLMREAAVEALSWIRDPAAVDALIVALKDPEGRVRRGAAEALGMLRVERARALLEPATSDPHEWTSDTAKWALAQLSAAAPPAK